jgi:hypothetical protein
VNESKLEIGESAVTAAPFFDSAGRPPQPFWGPQQGNKLVLWESLNEEEKVKCWELLQQEKGWAVWCRANPGKKDKGEQEFRKYGRCIFTGKCKQGGNDSTNREEAPGGKHVTTARRWWKRGDVAACATHANMACLVHQDSILDNDGVIQSLKEAWEQERSKNELKIDFQGLERQSPATG